MITAKVSVSQHATQAAGTDHEQVEITFVPDYNDGRNKEWAKYTPALILMMTVKPSIVGHFPVGQAFTLTFEPEE